MGFYDINNYEEEICPACNGEKVQYSSTDGLKHRCPMCQGKGKIRRRG